jgi:hypothetical protein
LEKKENFRMGDIPGTKRNRAGQGNKPEKNKKKEYGNRKRNFKSDHPDYSGGKGTA